MCNEITYIEHFHVSRQWKKPVVVTSYVGIEIPLHTFIHQFTVFFVVCAYCWPLLWMLCDVLQIAWKSEQNFCVYCIAFYLNPCGWNNSSEMILSLLCVCIICVTKLVSHSMVWRNERLGKYAMPEEQWNNHYKRTEMKRMETTTKSQKGCIRKSTLDMLDSEQ